MNKFTKKDGIYLILIIVLIIIDQMIKNSIQENLQVGESITVIKNFFKLTYVRNMGAAFGILQNHKNLFLFVGFITIIACLYLFATSDKKIIKICISLIITGGIGNIIDRIKYGYVVDMFDFHGIWPYVFNFADICVVVGISLLVIVIFKEK